MATKTKIEAHKGSPVPFGGNATRGRDWWDWALLNPAEHGRLRAIGRNTSSRLVPSPVAPVPLERGATGLRLRTGHRGRELPPTATSPGSGEPPPPDSRPALHDHRPDRTPRPAARCARQRPSGLHHPADDLVATQSQIAPRRII